MARIRVVTDSTADMDAAEIERLGITVVPLRVHLGGRSYRDKVELTLDEFYRKLREEKGKPTTSQPAPGDFTESFERAFQGADHLIAVHVGSRWSGTFSTAQAAAQAVAPNRITVIDSGTVAYPLGALALRVAGAADSGATLDQCLELIEDVKPRLRLFAILDTVEFLRRGGRIGRASALAAGMLAIKPIVQVLQNELLPVERVRTRAASITRAGELLRDLGPVEEVAILHADDPAPAETLVELARGYWPGMDIKRGTIGPCVGTHTGPRPFGFAAVLAKR